MLIIICGLQGTGKTTVAKIITKVVKAILLRTDVIRKELINNPVYSEAEKQLIYREMFSRAKALLLNKNNVILDGTFAKKINRDQAGKLARETNNEFKIVEVRGSSKEIIKQRLNDRIKDESDGLYKHYLKYKKVFEPITEEHVIIDNVKTIKDLEKQINNYF